jgi:NADH:ubiquinone oxidoreductase subunit E
MGMELDEIADDGTVALGKLVELAEDRGRPASHYVVALPLATELTLAKSGGTEVRICAGNCQSYGALVLIDHLVARSLAKGGITITPVECLDRCDVPPACELRGPGGQLVLAPATTTNLDEALDAL